MRFAVASATADNDFRYLISSGLKVPPPLVILIPYTRWKAHCTPPPDYGVNAIVRDSNTYNSDMPNP